MDQNVNGGGAPQNQSATAPTMPAVSAMPNMAAPGPQMPGMPVMPGMPGGAGQIPQYGEKKGSVAETIILIIVCLIAIAAIVGTVYYYLQWSSLNDDFEIRKNEEVQKAVKEQQVKDEKSFEEQEKLPNREFTGPSDYGTLSFYFPKTWSVYIESDGERNSDFKGYFSPSQIDAVNKSDSRYALRFMIYNRQFNDVIKTYQSRVKNGKCTSSVFNADNNKITGSKFEGEIANGIRGIVVVVKVNDKTAVLQTDSEEYRADFEALVTSLRRNS